MNNINKSKGEMMRYLKFWLIALGLFIFTACAQERLVFHPAPLPAGYSFHFPKPYHEYNIPVAPEVNLNALLFPAQQPASGIVLYLHGNSGNIAFWGEHAVDHYRAEGYDLLMFDYRGFGKSGGQIKNEAEIYADNQKVYDFVKNNLHYPEDKIVIVGYSIGTGMAAKLAADNHPKALVLLAPYYDIPSVAQQFLGVIPKFLVKYKIPTHAYLRDVRSPVYIFHGLDDEIIYPEASRKMKAELGEKVKVVFLPQQLHEYMEDNAEYRRMLPEILR